MYVHPPVYAALMPRTTTIPPKWCLGWVWIGVSSAMRQSTLVGEECWDVEKRNALVGSRFRTRQMKNFSLEGEFNVQIRFHREFGPGSIGVKAL